MFYECNSLYKHHKICAVKVSNKYILKRNDIYMYVFTVMYVNVQNK